MFKSMIVIALLCVSCTATRIANAPNHRVDFESRQDRHDQRR